MKALISVFDKHKLEELARPLNELGIEIIATEGTAQELARLNIPVTRVSEFVGYPEIERGNVKIKTLHPRIHVGIATGEIGILAVNLIPLSLDLKNIDVGGVAMLLSAIKNFEKVATIVNPMRYSRVMEELRERGEISYNTKLKLAKEATKYLLSYIIEVDRMSQRI